MNTKAKGSRWEREFAELINDNIPGADAKRIPTSGAMGKTLDLPILYSDVTVTIPAFPKKLRFECKVRSGEKSITVEKEWFNKNKEEAEASYSIPAIACKFSGARKSDGVQYFVAFDMDTFYWIVNYINDLKRELDLNYEQ